MRRPVCGFGVLAAGGDYAVIGAAGEDAGGSVDSGAAQTFINNAGTWIEQAKLTAGDTDPGDLGGFSVAVSGDSASIGALGDDSGGTDAGAAYAFFGDQRIWVQEAKFGGDMQCSFNTFGTSVSLNGPDAIVGAWKDDDAGVSPGSAFLFRRVRENWSLRSKLTAPNAVAHDTFGSAVALSANEAFIGATGDDDAGSSSGSVSVFRCDWSGQPDWLSSIGLQPGRGDFHQLTRHLVLAIPWRTFPLCRAPSGVM